MARQLAFTYVQNSNPHPTGPHFPAANSHASNATLPFEKVGRRSGATLSHAIREKKYSPYCTRCWSGRARVSRDVYESDHEHDGAYGRSNFVAARLLRGHPDGDHGRP